MSKLNTTAHYDVIVAGAGHAGVEAAAAAARMGCKTLLLTHNLDTIGQMSCNPAIGGIGKGHLVKEIDALDGVMGIAIDEAGIQFRILNASKGPAVQATRAQADRTLYKIAVRKRLEQYENLFILQQAVADLILDAAGTVVGISTEIGLQFHANAVVLTVGTFLHGKIHVGLQHTQGGRAGCQATVQLAEKLRMLPLRVGRLKTGTPPRIDGRTINFDKLQQQWGDTPTPAFSFLGGASMHPRQVSCHITHTNSQTHDIIRNSLAQSPMYSGAISGTGPRYCPSIEDKIVRFSDKEHHQIFLEPESLELREFYPNGISTSLPYAVQKQFVHSIVGLENAHITRPGYAIEYDFFDPRDLEASLQSKFLPRLFLAGQINGTTGYEEAAAQGLVAGINAALYATGQTAWLPQRADSYLGVLIDDLITKGTKEPYRMFTSRAEYRLSLREDNADLRLTAIGRALGVVGDYRWQKFSQKREDIEREQQRVRNFIIHPHDANGKSLGTKLKNQLQNSVSIFELLKRPDCNYNFIAEHTDFTLDGVDLVVLRQIEIQAKYHGYLVRQQDEVQRLAHIEHENIPAALDYTKISGLSKEIQEKLNSHRPHTIGQASRIPGITPAAISLLLVYVKKYHYTQLITTII